MSKIYVIHENNEWTEHLVKRLKELALEFELWHLDEGTIDLSSAPPEGVFFNRISASSHTRDHRFAPELTEAVLAWLERHKRVVINGSRALRLEVSKVNQYMALDAAGIATPKTIAVAGKHNIVDAAKKLNMDAFITKHNRAGKGQGVKLFHSIAALQEYLDSPEYEAPVDGITLLQQYIKAPEPFIVRHEFINGKFLYAVQVDTSEGFELCPADACSIEDLVCPADGGENLNSKQEKFTILENYRPAFIDKYEAFLAENNIKVAGIEAIRDSHGKAYTYDVNTNTNYNSDAENKAQQFAMLELAKYLGEQLKR